MKRTILPEPGARDRPGKEQIRLQRAALDLSRKLESLLLNANSVYDVFNNRANDLRNRLKEQCQTILLKDASDFGRKAEDMIWRKCYHEVMQFYKRYKKELAQEEITLLETHFVAGIGYYYNILITFSMEYDVDLTRILPETDRLLVYSEEQSYPETSAHESKWAYQTVHRLLIYLGDIARYLDELGYYGSFTLATKWYEAAILWDPKSGMPYNQLGTLVGNGNYGFDAAYHYMRCLFSDKPFDGAESNLRRILASNVKSSKDWELSQADLESSLIVKRCITKFLHLSNIFWTTSGTNGTNISSAVEDCLSSLKQALELPLKLSLTNRPSHLEAGVIFKMSICCLMFVGRLQRSLVGDESLHSASIAFALNFLLLIIASCNSSLERRLETNANGKGTTNGFAHSVGNNNDHLSKEETPELSPRRFLSRFRRRKAAINFDDVDTNFVNVEDDDSELSELEETALSTIDALDIASDISDTGSICDERDLMSHMSSEDEHSQAPDVIEVASSLKSKSVAKVTNENDLHFLYYETPLPAVKIFCDWLKLNEKLMSFCSESFECLFSPFVQLLNNLMAVENKVLRQKEQLKEFKCSDDRWTQKHPLTCDLALLRFRLMEPYHSKNIDFSNQTNLNDDQQGFICLESVLSFGHFFRKGNNKISFEPFSKQFDYNTEARNGCLNLGKGGSNDLWFPLTKLKGFGNEIVTNSSAFSSPDLRESPRPTSLSLGEPVPSSFSPEPNLSDPNKQKQMVSMAHLWLKAEVGKLDDKVKGGNVHQLPPYLVVDSSGFCDNLSLVKDLVLSKRFIIVVPKVVLSDLDNRKKWSPTAREAIRWLEGQASQGTRSIKFQKENERLSLAPMKYPRRKEKEAFDFYLLLENCKWLNNRQNKVSDELQMVTLLTGSSSNHFPENAKAVAETASINIENVEVFVSKWRNSTKAKT